MANNRSITSADASFVLSSDDLALAAVQIQGFAADAAWAMGDTEVAQTVRGVDGRLSAGFVYGDYSMTITLMPDSDSSPVFDAIMTGAVAGRAVYRVNGVLTLPSNGYTYNLTRGIVTTGRIMPDGQRVLQPRTWTIMWERVNPVPIA